MGRRLSWIKLCTVWKTAALFLSAVPSPREPWHIGSISTLLMTANKRLALPQRTLHLFCWNRFRYDLSAEHINRNLVLQSEDFFLDNSVSCFMTIKSHSLSSEIHFVSSKQPWGIADYTFGNCRVSYLPSLSLCPSFCLYRVWFALDQIRRAFHPHRPGPPDSHA